MRKKFAHNFMNINSARSLQWCNMCCQIKMAFVLIVPLYYVSEFLNKILIFQGVISQIIRYIKQTPYEMYIFGYMLNFLNCLLYLRKYFRYNCQQDIKSHVLVKTVFYVYVWAGIIGNDLDSLICISSKKNYVSCLKVKCGTCTMELSSLSVTVCDHLQVVYPIVGLVGWLVVQNFSNDQQDPSILIIWISFHGDILKLCCIKLSINTLKIEKNEQLH